MKKLYYYFTVLMLLFAWQLNAQTTIIDPAGAGGFELGATFADNGWTVVNATTNTWNVGTTPAWFTGTGGAFVSNDAGVSWAYTNSATSRSHFYRDITVPSGETNIVLSFDWRANGNDGNWDNLQVYICDVTVTPETTGPIGTNTTTTTWTGYTNGTTGYYLTRVNGTTNPTSTSTVNYTLTAAQAAYLAVGTPKRIVFTWKNDGSGGSNPPSSIDNISLVSSCVSLTTAAVSNITKNSATLNSATFATATGYNFRYREVGSATWVSATGNPYATNSASISGLSINTDYEFQVNADGPVCNLWSNSGIFSTLPDYCAGDLFLDNGGAGDYSNNSRDTIVICPDNPVDIVYVNFNFFNTELGYDGLVIYNGPNTASPIISSGNTTNRTSHPAGAWSGTGIYSLTGTNASQMSTDASGCLTFTFASDGSGFRAGWEATVTCAPPPTCPVPSALAESNIGSDTVNLNWVSGGANNWIIEYGVSGFTQGMGDFVTVSVDTFTTLTGLTPDTDYEVYLRDSCGPGDLSNWVGPISFTTLVSCPVSTNFNDSLISQTEVQLSWDVISSASSWQIEYGFDGFTQGSIDGIYATAGTNPFNISGLQTDTTYDFYVRDVCAPGDTSLWVGPLSVYTGYCLVSTTYTSDYLDSISTTGGSSNLSYSASSQPAGSYANETTQILEIYPNGSFDIFTSYVGGTNGVKVWVDWNNDLDFDDLGEEIFAFPSANTDKTGSYLVPLSTNLGSYRMRVRAQYNNSNPPSCGNVSYSSTVDFTLNIVAPPPCVTPTMISSNVLSYDSVQLNWTAGATESEWIIEYNLVGSAVKNIANATATTDTLFGLIADSDYEYRVRSYCGVADSSAWSNVFTFTTPVSCPAPTSLVVNAVGTDTALISWISGGANDWIVEYGVSGFTPGTGTLITDTFVVLTGLSSSSVYDFYVRDYCGVADSSVWIQTSFATLCSPFTAPYSQNFDSYPTAADFNNAGVLCWTAIGPGANDIEVSSTLDFTGTIPSLPNAIEFNDGEFPADTSILVSPQFSDLPSGLNRIRFQAAFESDIVADVTLYVGVMTDPNNSATFIPLDTIDASDVGGEYTFDEVIINLDNTAQIGSAEYIAFVHGRGIFEAYIDDFVYEPIPSCDLPIALLNNNVSTDTVDISWTSNGVGTVYEIAYGVSGFTPTATADILNIMDTFYTINGLTSSTDYDVYVRANCGPGDSSVWAGPISFTTLATCLEPINLDASNFTFSSATASWTPNGVAAEWEVEYGVSGFVPTGTPSITAIIDTFVNIASLSSQTDYDFFVRSRCSAIDSSTWAGPFTFTTLPDYCAGDIFVDNGGLTSDYLSNTNDTIVICPNSPNEIVTVTFNTFDVELNYDGMMVYDGPNTSSPLISSGSTGVWGEPTCPPGAWTGTGAFALTGVNAVQTSTDASGCLTFVFLSDGIFNESGWDASVVCNPRPADDIAVNEILNLTANTCGSSQTVIELEVSNQGTVNQYNVPVTVEVAGGFTQTFNVIIDSILSNQVINVVVDSFNTTSGGSAVITAYSSLVGDADLSNDTISGNYVFNSVLDAPVFADSTYVICNGDSANLDVVTSGAYVAWYSDAAATDLVYEGTSLNYNFNVDSTFYVKTNDSTAITYTLELSDYWDDGWDGASLEVTADGMPVVGSPFFTSSVALTFNFDVYANQEIVVTYVAGSYDSENKYVLLDNNGNVLFEDGDFTNAPFIGVAFTKIVDEACLSDATMVQVNMSPLFNDTVSVTVCDEFTFSNNTVMVSGMYTDTLATVNGCDSLVTYNVAVNNSSSQTQAVSVCSNDTIVVGNNQYFATGIYTDTLATVNGCDSIIITDLTVNVPSTVTIVGLTPTICEDAGIINLNVSPMGGTLSGPGVVGNDFDPAVAGQGVHTISYSLTDTNNCSAFLSADVEVIECVGIKEISGIKAIDIYPNPFINSINLQFNDTKSGDLLIQLFDMNGKLIVSQKAVSTYGLNTIEVLVPVTIANGVHVIQIERGGKTFSKSLLKK